MVLELIIFFSAVIAAYCIGNVTGFVQGRKLVEPQLLAQQEQALRAYTNEDRSELINDISRYSWAWDETSHDYRKVYDAEIIEFPGER
jgi:hypothetical protein